MDDALFAQYENDKFELENVMAIKIKQIMLATLKYLRLKFHAITSRLYGKSTISSILLVFLLCYVL